MKRKKAFSYQSRATAWRDRSPVIGPRQGCEGVGGADRLGWLGPLRNLQHGGRLRTGRYRAPRRVLSLQMEKEMLKWEKVAEVTPSCSVLVLVAQASMYVTNTTGTLNTGTNSKYPPKKNQTRQRGVDSLNKPVCLGQQDFSLSELNQQHLTTLHWHALISDLRSSPPGPAGEGSSLSRDAQTPLTPDNSMQFTFIFVVSFTIGIDCSGGRKPEAEAPGQYRGRGKTPL